MNAVLHAITDLGDGAVLLPLAGLIAIALYRCGWKAGAQAMVAAVLAAGGLITLAKLAFIGCGAAAQPWGLHSPSGHAALSSSIYGTLALLITRSHGSPHRGLVVAGTLALVTLIAVTRVTLHYHTAEEVVLGLAVGLVAVAVAAAIIKHPPPSLRLPWRKIGWIGVGLVLVLHGLHLPAEGLVHFWAHRFGHEMDCQAFPDRFGT